MRRNIGDAIGKGIGDMDDAIQCEYSIEGAGPPLFLIHGIGASRDGWRYVVPELASAFTCITYDLRGHGASPLPRGEFGLDDLVADLEDLRARLGIERAHFAGHSLGGMIAPAYARAHPERVLTLGLLSTAAGRSEEDRGKLARVYRMLEEHGIPRTLEVLADRWFTDTFARARPGVVEGRLAQVLATDPGVFLNVFRIYADTEMAPWLKDIKAPSLVLTAENDGGCNPRLNRFIAAEIPESELIILKRYRHAILLEAPGEVAAHLKRFIERRSRRSGPRALDHV